MPDSEAKKKWMKENAIIFSIKLMKRSEADIVNYVEENLARGIGKNTLFKMALREYMENHPVESKEPGKE